MIYNNILKIKNIDNLSDIERTIITRFANLKDDPRLDKKSDYLKLAILSLMNYTKVIYEEKNREFLVYFNTLKSLTPIFTKNIELYDQRRQDISQDQTIINDKSSYICTLNIVQYKRIGSIKKMVHAHFSTKISS